MATLTLLIDNDKTFNNLKNILKLMKGVTILPAVNHKTVSRKNTKNIDLSGIGGSWASEDFPTTEELHAMRKSSHLISEL